MAIEAIAAAALKEFAVKELSGAASAEFAKQQLAEKLAGTQTSEMTRLSQQEALHAGETGARELGAEKTLCDAESAKCELGEKLGDASENISARLDNVLDHIENSITEKVESSLRTVEGLGDKIESLGEDFCKKVQDALDGIGDKIREEFSHLQMKLETGWSDEILDNIETSKQYEIFKNAGLEEKIVNARECLCKVFDADFWKYKDEKGLTNLGRCQAGLAPIDPKTGEKIELHHIGQNSDSPFAELTESEHRGKQNHSELHRKETESWRHDPDPSGKYDTLGDKFNHERAEHWKARAQEYLNSLK